MKGQSINRFWVRIGEASKWKSVEKNVSEIQSVGKRLKEIRRVQGVRASVRAGTNLGCSQGGRVTILRRGAAGCGELSVCGERSQDENLGTKQRIFKECALSHSLPVSGSPEDFLPA